jgi:adenosine kinase
MSALICGSLAFDTIMVFPDQFKNHILPDKVHILNVSFLVPRMRREFGGCAGNIAYNLHLLGGQPIPMGTVGRTSARTASTSRPGHRPVARARDRRAVHPAGVHHHRPRQQPDHRLPPGRDDAFLREPRARRAGRDPGHGRPGRPRRHDPERAGIPRDGIPFIFDPGQAMPLFNGPELRAFIEQADYVVVNDYESNLLQERTGWDEKEIVSRVKAYITTRGPKGAVIHTPEKSYDIPPAHERRVVDPTGCGDAFRAGLIYGIQKGYDWLTIGRMGNLMGALKVEHPGTQNQRFTFDEFNEQFKQQFGYALGA